MSAPERESLFSACGETVTVKRLVSGYWHLRGSGPCNWAQPQHWPDSDLDALEASFFAEASEPFRRAVRAENERLLAKPVATYDDVHQAALEVTRMATGSGQEGFVRVPQELIWKLQTAIAGEAKAALYRAPLIAVDAKGYCWRVLPGEFWSMCPVNSDNSPIPRPLTFYAPVEMTEAQATAMANATDTDA